MVCYEKNYQYIYNVFYHGTMKVIKLIKKEHFVKVLNSNYYEDSAMIINLTDQNNNPIN